MGRRYYRRYRRSYDRNFNSPIEMLLEMLLAIFLGLIKLLFRLVLNLFNLIRECFYTTKVDKKVLPDVQAEIQPIPETHFEENEHEKEVYLPYRKKTFLLTRAEYNFDRVLREVVQDEYYIGRQVALSSIVEVTSTYKPYKSKIDKKTIDFVLFNKAGYTPYLAIELDDSSHLRFDRIERDRFVEEVLSKAGIRIVRVKNAYYYNTSKIIELIK